MRIVFILLLVPVFAFAQKQNKAFRLPQGASPSHFSPSTVLVKLKKEYAQIFSKGAANPIKHLVKSVSPILTEGLQRKNQARMGPRVSLSKIDPATFFEIGFEGGDIESFINQLYATGYFELVEPDYVAQLHFNPNDEKVASQYYLNKIRAFEAWDITQGSEDLVIGIIDSGGDLDHPDLASQLYINENDPIDFKDNDNDGFIDNYRGWDFMGNDTLNINYPNFPGDNNPNNPNDGIGSHGSAVAGCAAAATNNGFGIAGVGFKTKLLFTKHAADNQGAKKAGIYKGYEGILYAASQGAKIINCSWGGPYRSQIYQDLITYVTLDLGCLLVASAGNEGTQSASYPASYDHVISVAASDQNDLRASFSNYGKSVDIIAPGKGIQTTFFDNSFTSIDGTSFSSPIVAGAAALVWANNPELTSTQIAQQLRVSADPIIYQNSATFFQNKLGKGRLDIVNALTRQYPSIHAGNPRLVNANGTNAEPGQEGRLSLDFINFLAPSSSALTITVTPVLTNWVSISNATIRPGQLETNQTINNKLNPILLQLHPNLPNNTVIDLLVTYADGEYNDFEFVSFTLNPTFIDIDDNAIVTTLASNGRLGFENTKEQSNGSGFVFNGNKLLYEMGLIAGTSNAKLFDNVRAMGSSYNEDFIMDQKIKETSPGERSYSEIFGSLTDNNPSKTVSINYRSLVWKEKPYDQFIILEYTIKNVSAGLLSGFHFALFADWDITDLGGGDVAEWNADLKMGYVHPAQSDDKPYAGIKLLTEHTPQYFPIDNDQNISGTPFGLYDGFSDAEKFKAISSGIGRQAAGTTSGTGNDVSHVVGAGPLTIPANGEIVIAFALLAGVNWDETKRAAQQADTAYNYMLKAVRPSVQDVKICYGKPVTLEATGASQFKWYKDFSGGQPIHFGSSLTTGNIFRDTTFYVSNADEKYESVRTAAHVSLGANPSILTSGSTTICEGSIITLSAANADQYLWSTGATTQSIEVGTAGKYSIRVQDNSLGCNSSSNEIEILINPAPVSEFQVEGDLNPFSEISFINSSVGAAQYLWNFGDGATSTEVSPSHTYFVVKDYNVTLTVTNDLGCTALSEQAIAIITGLENDASVQVYPVPFTKGVAIQTEWDYLFYTLTDVTGKIYDSSSTSITNKSHTVHLPELPTGVYFLTISDGNKTIKRRLIKY
jgi:subtilisin family serine protease/PKD repeat protein